MIFQSILIIFAIIVLAKTYRQYQAHKVSLYWAIVWSLMWIILIIVAFTPQTTDIIAKYVGVEKGADLFVYSSIVIIFYALYRILSRQEKMNKETTNLVRQIAILEAKKRKDE